MNAESEDPVATEGSPVTNQTNKDQQSISEPSSPLTARFASNSDEKGEYFQSLNNCTIGKLVEH